MLVEVKTAGQGARGMSFSPDGERLAIPGPEDNTATVWEIATGKEVATLKEPHRGRHRYQLQP
jgi:hypothetical protein